MEHTIVITSPFFFCFAFNTHILFSTALLLFWRGLGIALFLFCQYYRRLTITFISCLRVIVHVICQISWHSAFCDVLHCHNCSLTPQPAWPMYTVPHEWGMAYTVPSWQGMSLFTICSLHCDFCSEHLFTFAHNFPCLSSAEKNTGMSNSLTDIFKLWQTLWQWLITAPLVSLLACSGLPYLVLSIAFHSHTLHNVIRITLLFHFWLGHLITKTLFYCVQARFFQCTIQAVFANTSFYFLWTKGRVALSFSLWVHTFNRHE